VHHLMWTLCVHPKIIWRRRHRLFSLSRPVTRLELPVKGGRIFLSPSQGAYKLKTNLYRTHAMLTTPCDPKTHETIQQQRRHTHPIF
jgi:hypothetical protein